MAFALALAPCAAFAAPRLDAIAVQVLAGSGHDVVISVSIERPRLRDLNCDAVIHPGDGSSIPVSWRIGDGRTKTARYEFKRAGTYRVRVAGAGSDGCAGEKQASVSVGTPRAQKSALPRCPSGWLLVEATVRGARYTCRARPPAQPLRCAEGTSYFAEGGEIGCR